MASPVRSSASRVAALTSPQRTGSASQGKLWKGQLPAGLPGASARVSIAAEACARALAPVGSISSGDHRCCWEKGMRKWSAEVWL